MNQTTEPRAIKNIKKYRSLENALWALKQGQKRVNIHWKSSCI